MCIHTSKYEETIVMKQRDAKNLTNFRPYPFPGLLEEVAYPVDESWKMVSPDMLAMHSMTHNFNMPTCFHGQTASVYSQLSANEILPLYTLECPKLLDRDGDACAFFIDLRMIFRNADSINICRYAERASIDSASSGISTDPRINPTNTERHQPPDMISTGQELRQESLNVHNEKDEYVYPPPIIANTHDGIFPELANYIKCESIESGNELLLTGDNDNILSEPLNFIDETFLRGSLEDNNDAYYATVNNTFLPSPSSHSDSDSYTSLDSPSRSSSPGSLSESDISSIHNTEFEMYAHELRSPEIRPPAISSTCIPPKFLELREDDYFDAANVFGRPIAAPCVQPC